MNLSQIIKTINENIYFAFLVSATGLIGFVISLYISAKTASISKELNKIKIGKEYNRTREKYIDRFIGHKKSILEDNDHSELLADTILQDITTMEIAFKPLFSSFERFLIIRAKSNLRRSRVNFKVVCHHLTYLIGRLNKKEDIYV